MLVQLLPYHVFLKSIITDLMFLKASVPHQLQVRSQEYYVSFSVCNYKPNYTLRNIIAIKYK